MIKGWTAGEVLLVVADAKRNKRRPEDEVARRLMIDPVDAKTLIRDCEQKVEAQRRNR